MKPKPATLLGTRPFYVGQEKFLEAIDLFAEASDEPRRVTDAASFILMRNLNPATAFAFDPRFREAGFHTLPE